jgi:hypothetical protein
MRSERGRSSESRQRAPSHRRPNLSARLEDRNAEFFEFADDGWRHRTIVGSKQQGQRLVDQGICGLELIGGETLEVPVGLTIDVGCDQVFADSILLSRRGLRRGRGW